MAARAAVEALLRERKLDRTLTSTLPERLGEDAVAPLDTDALDRGLAGGLPRGQVSEVVGPASSGRTSVAWAALAAASRRGESIALIDTFDRFDPPTAQACGIDLSHLLWVRGQAISKTSGAIDPAWLPGVRAVNGPGTFVERVIDRAIKALNLVVSVRRVHARRHRSDRRAGDGAAPLAGIDVVPRRARDRRQRHRGADSRGAARRAQRGWPIDRAGRRNRRVTWNRRARSAPRRDLERRPRSHAPHRRRSHTSDRQRRTLVACDARRSVDHASSTRSNHVCRAVCAVAAGGGARRRRARVHAALRTTWSRSSCSMRAACRACSAAPRN